MTIMKFSDHIDHIESHDFAATVRVASSVRTAIESVLADPAVRDLRKQLIDSEAAYHVLARVLALASQGIDFRYENPNDTALFVYILLLGECSAELSLIAASAVCQVPNLWWASEVAAAVLDNRRLRSDAASSRATGLDATTEATDRIFVSDTRRFLSSRARFIEFDTNALEDSSIIFTSGPVIPDWKDDALDTRDLALVPA
jgi:hypothetical protein